MAYYLVVLTARILADAFRQLFAVCQKFRVPGLAPIHQTFALLC